MHNVVNTTKVLRISPMLAASSLEATRDFYTGVLGFSVVMDAPDYLILERDGQTIHFEPVGEDILSRVRGHTEIYIEVAKIDSLWKHVQTFEGRYRIKGLLERDYGMREFHIVDPNGCLIFVGETTR